MAGPNDTTSDPITEDAVAAQAGTASPARPADLSEAFPELEAAEAETTDAVAASSPASQSAGRNIDAMFNVDLRVQVILGHARMPISQLLKLSRGSVIELDRKIGEPVDVVINDRLVARGDLVKLSGDRIGVTLTEIIKDYVLDN